jgi:predicted house-cleaning noncanonical NTP pyrophosphatase (MazG superfamily)
LSEKGKEEIKDMVNDKDLEKLEEYLSEKSYLD